MAVGGAETPLDIGRRECGEGVEEPAPDRAGRPVLSDILVGNPRQAGIIPRPLRHFAIARPGSGSLTAGPGALATAFLAVVSRHPDSPAQSLFSMQERRPQVEGQGKLNCAL